MVDLIEWTELRDDFTDGLVLGNGTSISIDDRFAYKSILDYASTSGRITEEVRAIFDHLHTEDFELILRIIWHASHVNEALGIEDDKTSEAYAGIRNSLIETIRDVHPEYQQVDGRLVNGRHFLRHFDTICSLNYDILVYWVMMIANELDERHSFKDCFNAREFDREWERMRDPIRGEEKCTLVFYPHGNLILARDKIENERKLFANNSSHDLLSSILASWESGAYIPLFVSEGTTDQKLKSISSSYYLGTVYREVLPRMGATLTTFGWSFGDQDMHIVDRLSVGKPRAIAVALPNNQDAQANINRISQVIKDHMGSKVDALFYDAASVQLWDHEDS